ncbi:hypothetical protein MVES_001627 [Malassezia vespertilionis]|uniref:Uncharacterized protein n=1 Tax=Malassezia vespertilionis TaxID=2020962 RepID=A0A2N1JCR0_9BASI|nr:hypothetical protein MVES_001627 [Malassezia vespertilionis]
MSLLRQSVIRSTQSASRVSARSYSSAPNAGPSMIERLQQAGSSFAKTAERSLGSYSEPIMYNLRVAGSFLKQVYISEKLAPPMHLKNWTDAYRQIWQDVSSHKWWTQTLPSGQWRSR